VLTASNIRGMGYRPLSNGGALLGTGRKYNRVFGNGPGWFGALAFNNTAMAWPSYGKLDKGTAILAPFKTGTIRGTAAGAATTDANLEGEGDLASEVTGLATTDALGELGAEIAAEAYGVATTDADIEGNGDMASELLIGGPFTGESLSGELLATKVEGDITVGGALRLILASAAAKLSGAPAGPVVIRDANDTKNRITATVDANGNRLAVTLDPD
jgi:hypothetical protein